MDTVIEKGMEELILEKAEELFMKRGYALTSTVEIAKAAGCNQALVHYYFRSKDKLFQKIFLSKIGLFLSMIFRIDDYEEDFFENLKKKIGAHFDLLAKNPRLPFLILNELTTNQKNVIILKEEIMKEKTNRSVFLKLEQTLNVEIKKGTVRPMTVTDLIINIISMNAFLFLSMPIIQGVFDIKDDKKREFIEHRREENITTIINGIRP